MLSFVTTTTSRLQSKSYRRAQRAVHLRALETLTSLIQSVDAHDVKQATSCIGRVKVNHRTFQRAARKVRTDVFALQVTISNGTHRLPAKGLE